MGKRTLLCLHRAFCSDNLFWLECTKNSSLERCLELCDGEGLRVILDKKGNRRLRFGWLPFCSSSSSHLRAIPSCPEIHILLSTLSELLYLFQNLSSLWPCSAFGDISDVHPFFHSNLSANNTLPVTLNDKDKIAVWGLPQRSNPWGIFAPWVVHLPICQLYCNFI